MTKSFTGPEFLKALTAGALKPDLVLEGMAKADGADALLFSPGRACTGWTRIPVGMVEHVEFLSLVRCDDHEHPLVRLALKEPAGSARRRPCWPTCSGGRCGRGRGGR